jgi:hypothetical protein
MKQKYILVLITIFLFFKSFSQELSLGVHAGLMPTSPGEIISFGGSLEYRPLKSIISLNTDPYIFNTGTGLIFTAPLSMKLILGDKVRICPTIGAFIRSNENTGWQYGLDIDYKSPDNIIFFLKGEICRDHWMEQYYSHSGSVGSYPETGNILLISCGIKLMIIKTPNK